MGDLLPDLDLHTRAGLELDCAIEQ